MYRKNNIRYIFKKLLIVLIGIIFVLILLEISLRIFGSFFHQVIDQNNRGDKQSHTILAIGDSYTYGIGSTDGLDYPFQLKQLLNKNSDARIDVINAGLNGQNSAQAVEQIEDNISKFKPEVIILLIGISNYWNYYGYNKSIFSFVNNIKIFKLVKLLYGNIRDRLNHEAGKKRIYNFDKNEILKEKMIFNDVFKKQKKFSKQYNNYGVFLVRVHEFDVAINWFKASMIYDSLNYYNYEGIVYAYISEKKYNEAIQFLKESINKDHDTKLYSLLAYVFSSVPDNDQAEKWLKKGIEKNDRSGMLYFQLGKNYFIQNRIEESVKTLLKGISIQPYCIDYYDYLTIIKDRLIRKDERIESALKKDSLNRNKFFSYNDTIDIRRYFYRISTSDAETGNISEVNNELDNNINSVSEWLKNDIVKIIRVCRKYNIKLIIQNYPLSHIPPPDLPANIVLKNCATENDVIFADNIRYFSESGSALKNFFVPDEHCNNKGYGMIARNLFDKIVSENIFGIDTSKQSVIKDP